MKWLYISQILQYLKTKKLDKIPNSELYISQILQYLKTHLNLLHKHNGLYISQILQYLKTVNKAFKDLQGCTSLKYYSILKLKIFNKHSL